MNYGARRWSVHPATSPKRLGSLNWPMDRILINSMSPRSNAQGHELKVADRRELYAKLIQEYFAIDKNNPGI